MKCDICGGDKRVVGYCGLVYNPKGIPPLIHYVCLNCTIGVKPVEKKKSKFEPFNALDDYFHSRINELSATVRTFNDLPSAASFNEALSRVKELEKKVSDSEKTFDQQADEFKSAYEAKKTEYTLPFAAAIEAIMQGATVEGFWDGGDRFCPAFVLKKMGTIVQDVTGGRSIQPMILGDIVYSAKYKITVPAEGQE